MIHRDAKSLDSELRSLTSPPVVVVGLCSHGLALVRAFARKGIPVYAIEADFRQPSARTRFGVRIRCDSLYGPALIDLLSDLADRAARKPVLLVTNDKMVRLVNGHRDRLQEKMHLPFADAALLDRMIDKEALTALAGNQGMRVPETRVVAREDDVACAGTSVGYPHIVKPAQSMGTFKALLVQDSAALLRVVADHPEVSRFILQRWIEGGDERIFFTNHYFGPRGEALATFVGQKIRQYPRLFGSASCARGADRPDVAREGLRMFEGLGYRGFGAAEFKVDPEGRAWFIEVTVGRTEYLVKAALSNGVDLLSVAYDDLARGTPARAMPQKNRRVWVDLDRDWEVYLESWFDPSVRKGDLIRFLVEPKTYELLDARDPAPFLAWLPTVAGRVIHKIAGKLRTRPGRASKAG